MRVRICENRIVCALKKKRYFFVLFFLKWRQFKTCRRNESVFISWTKRELYCNSCAYKSQLHFSSFADKNVLLFVCSVVTIFCFYVYLCLVVLIVCFYQRYREREKMGLYAYTQDSETISNNKDTLIIMQLVSCAVVTYSCGSFLEINSISAQRLQRSCEHHSFVD